MLRAIRLILLLCLSFSAAREATATELRYSLYVLGVPAADATLTLAVTPPDYRIALRFHTTGIADLFVGDRLDEHSRGRFANDMPAPADYASNGHLHGVDRVTDLIWRDGTPAVVAITPPNSQEREDVPPSMLAHVMDPLDAIVMLLHQVASNGRCEGTARAYDGRRLQLLQSRTVGEEEVEPSRRSSFSGRALRCEFTDQTLAGFRFSGSGRADDQRAHRGTIWLARLQPGAPLLPVRASVETRWLGDAVIYLTGAIP